MDQGVDQVYPDIGFGPDYLAQTGCTTYVAEFHIRYLRELHAGAMVTATFRLLDFDEKRLHAYQELWHEDGWLAASAEALTLHVDQSGPRVAPMPAHVLDNLAAMKDAQADLPWPADAGRRVGLSQQG